MRPPRVLIVATHPVQYASPQFRELQADPRIDVTVAYLSMYGTERDIDPDFGVARAWDIDLLGGYSWTHVTNHSPKSDIRGFLGLLNPGLWSLIRRGRFDVVVCYGYRSASAWIAISAARASGSKFVWTTDATGLEPRDRSSIKGAMKSILLPRVFALASAAIVPSTGAQRFVLSLGVPSAHVFVTPYAVDNAFFSEGAKASDPKSMRKELGIPSDAFVALFVGKLASWKRPQDLLLALRAVSGAWGLFVGEGESRHELEALAARIGVDERAVFAGFRNQSELPGCYAAADVLVLPSEYEPFGLVVNEAFASGIPAIVSDRCGAVGDLVIDGVTGFVYRAGDVNALAAHLGNLMRDPLTRRRVSQRAQAQIATWGPKQNLEATVAAISVISGREALASVDE